MKTKLALICLSFIATNSYSQAYIEFADENDLGDLDAEIARAWQNAYGDDEVQQTVQNKGLRRQDPKIEQEFENEIIS